MLEKEIPLRNELDTEYGVPEKTIMGDIEKLSSNTLSSGVNGEVVS
jgi:hypothetical protein